MLGLPPPEYEAWYHIQGEVPLKMRYDIDPPDWWHFSVYNSQGQRTIVSEWEMTYDAMARIEKGTYGETLRALPLPMPRSKI